MLTLIALQKKHILLSSFFLLSPCQHTIPSLRANDIPFFPQRQLHAHRLPVMPDVNKNKETNPPPARSTRMVHSPSPWHPSHSSSKLSRRGNRQVSASPEQARRGGHPRQSIRLRRRRRQQVQGRSFWYVPLPEAVLFGAGSVTRVAGWT
jgi:hypothetical protein